MVTDNGVRSAAARGAWTARACTWVGCTVLSVEAGCDSGSVAAVAGDTPASVATTATRAGSSVVGRSTALTLAVGPAGPGVVLRPGADGPAARVALRA